MKILIIIFGLMSLLSLAGLLALTKLKTKVIYRIVKADPCQVETIKEGIEVIESGDCDYVKVKDISGYKIPDEVDEFSIQGNKFGNGPEPEIKYYKRIDGVFKQVFKAQTPTEGQQPPQQESEQ